MNRKPQKVKVNEKQVFNTTVQTNWHLIRPTDSNIHLHQDTLCPKKIEVFLCEKMKFNVHI